MNQLIAKTTKNVAELRQSNDRDEDDSGYSGGRYWFVGFELNESPSVTLYGTHILLRSSPGTEAYLLCS